MDKNILKTFLKVNIIKILSSFEKNLHKKSSAQFYSKPFDLHLKEYFTENKKLGSHDRQIISELSYKLIRYKEFLDLISPKPLDWTVRLETMLSTHFENQLKNESLPLYYLFDIFSIKSFRQSRASCPQELFNVLKDEFGELNAFKYCKAVLGKAPLTIRTNPIKISRDDVKK